MQGLSSLLVGFDVGVAVGLDEGEPEEKLGETVMGVAVGVTVTV